MQHSYLSGGAGAGKQSNEAEVGFFCPYETLSVSGTLISSSSPGGAGAGKESNEAEVGRRDDIQGQRVIVPCVRI